MYVPDLFREDDRERIAALIRDHAFALLITNDENGLPCGSHLPLIYDAERGPTGTLIGHMARSNSQWQHFDNGAEVLAVFTGPHAYVSPSWYETHPSVPTWNYVAIHSYGRPRTLHDVGEVRAVLARLVEINEAGFESPWRMDLPEAFESAMIGAIVAFEIPVSRIEAKFKLSQNRGPVDRANVAARLERADFDNGRGVAALMRENQMREGAG